MKDDEYLFEKRGPPDPEVARLEELLAPLGHDDRPLDEIDASSGSWGRLPAIAAGLLLGACIIFVTRGRMTEEKGAPLAAAPILRCSGNGETLEEGRWIEAVGDRRELALGDLGRIELHPGTRLQVRALAAEEARLYLAVGAIDATVSIDARPRFFQVDTDAARCVDLGCRYTLSVDEAGVAWVRVTSGRVAFEEGSREVYVPSGAECRARRDAGPGTPRFTDAPAALGAAFDAYDLCPREMEDARRRSALEALAAVRSGRDTLPAWHLLQDPDPEIARAAAERLDAVAGRPISRDTPLPAFDAAGHSVWKRHLEVECW